MVSVELPRLNVNSESKEVILSDTLSAIGTIFNNPISIKLHLTCGYFVQLATNHRPHSNIIAVRIRIIYKYKRCITIGSSSAQFNLVVYLIVNGLNRRATSQHLMR